MKPKLLFICKQRISTYGKSFGLVNSATFVARTMIQHGMDAKVIMVVDANDIDREVTKYNPTHVLIEALWVTADKFNEILSLPRHQNRQWIVRIHSKAPFIANEGIAFPWLVEYKDLQEIYPNFHVSCNSKEFNNSLRKVLRNKPIYLPNIYNPDCYVHEFTEDQCHKQNTINIGCFGSVRPMKNHLNQALAAIRFADEMGLHLKFHINSDRAEQNGDQTIKNLRALFSEVSHELVEHPWMDHRCFVKLVRTMDLGMQVSLTESFNIVAADFVFCGIPIVVSPEIDWMPWFAKADPNSVKSMVRHLKVAYYGQLIALESYSCYKLASWNYKSTKIWLKAINFKIKCS